MYFCSANVLHKTSLLLHKKTIIINSMLTTIYVSEYEYTR